MSVQFMRDPRPLHPGAQASGTDAAKLAGADPFRSLGPTDLLDVVRGYYAYFGRYEVAPTGDAITHFMETSLRPTEVGVAYKRAIRIEGDQLFISLRAGVDGVPRQRVLTWRRATLPVAITDGHACFHPRPVWSKLAPSSLISERIQESTRQSRNTAVRGPQAM